MGRIRKLPIDTQSVLSLAAAIGNTFELRMLSQVSESPVAHILRTIHPALLSGLMVQLDEDFKWLKIAEYHPDTVVIYQFLHDRVQQASYELIHHDERPQIHLKIGNLLLEKLNENEIEEKLFGKFFNLKKTSI